MPHTAPGCPRLVGHPARWAVSFLASLLLLLLLHLLRHSPAGPRRGASQHAAGNTTTALPSSCSLYVATGSGETGLGDLLTRFAMAFAVAQQLAATPCLDGTWHVPSLHASPDGRTEYTDVLRLLGLDAVAHVSAVRATRGTSLVELPRVDPRAARSAAQAACANGATAVLVLLDTDACPQWRQPWHRLFVDPPIRWCPNHHDVPGFDAVGWQLRQLGAGRATLQGGEDGREGRGQPSGVTELPFFEAGALNVAVHVRNGDVCVNCGWEEPTRPWSFANVVAVLDAALEGCSRVRLVFFSQLPLPWLAQRLPHAVQVTSANASVVVVAQHLLGAQLVVTGGSSLATSLVAFAGHPFAPAVLEAQTKESSWGCHGRGCPGKTHVLPHSFKLDPAGLPHGWAPAELRAALRGGQPQVWRTACGA